MYSTDRAIRFLHEIGRVDLAALLKHSSYDYGTREAWFDISVQIIVLSSPKSYCEAIGGLPECDQKRIAEAIHNTHPGKQPSDSVPESLELRTSDEEVSDNLLPELLIHRNQMIAVATGRGRIQDVDDYYKARQRRITSALKERGLDNPNKFDSLWDWYKKWRDSFGSYSERRRYINDMFAPVVARIIDAPETIVPAREPTGWDRVDRAVEKARTRMESARHEEDYQTVGLLCREVLISLGQAVYDPAIHIPPDGVMPSATDAGRMIDAFFGEAARGGSNENVRRHARAALQLAVELQHKRTADFRAAALCLEATSSVSNIVAILSGRRDRMPEELD